MSDVERTLRQVEQHLAPIKPIVDTINDVIPPYIQRLDNALQSVAPKISEVIRVLEPFLNQISSTLIRVAEAAQKWQVDTKADITVMADNGWYPNWFTFYYAPDTTTGSLDELMEKHLEDNWDDITSKILESCPNREHILTNAFELHKQGNYIASIPLFLAHADGITCEELKSFLFTKNETQQKLQEMMDSGKIEANMFTDVFLEPFKLKNHYNQGISKSGTTAKRKAPNRNGILHGHRKHLDYGTKTNSLKCFSLLAFVVFTVKDLVTEI